jgi:hypothetical protein
LTPLFDCGFEICNTFALSFEIQLEEKKQNQIKIKKTNPNPKSKINQLDTCKKSKIPSLQFQKNTVSNIRNIPTWGEKSENYFPSGRRASFSLGWTMPARPVGAIPTLAPCASGVVMKTGGCGSIGATPEAWRRRTAEIEPPPFVQTFFKSFC